MHLFLLWLTPLNEHVKERTRTTRKKEQRIHETSRRQVHVTLDPTEHEEHKLLIKFPQQRERPARIHNQSNSSSSFIKPIEVKKLLSLQTTR